MTSASSREAFMRFDTKGMSCRRMSPPPSVLCWENETGTCRPFLGSPR